jgi:putative DNA primase/helicase
MPTAAPTRFTKTSPCPVCQTGTKGCSALADGLHWCRGEPADPGRWKCVKRGEPFCSYRAVDDDRNLRNGHTRPPVPPTTKPAADLRAAAERYARYLTPDRRAELAASLGLQVAALDALPLLGFNPAANGACFTFPEVDSAGTVVGLNRRYPDGSKRMLAGGRRGLTIPSHWQEKSGPVFVPEGPSDVLGLTAAGLAAVGRPSNTGGVVMLAGLLADLDAGRDIIILGENDRKPDGRWPGRAGAESVARALAAKLGRPIKVALPPDGSKDVRAFLTDPVRGETPWPTRGRALAAHLTTAAVPVDPPGTDQPADRQVFPPPVEGEEWNDPHRLARLFIDRHRTPSGERTLVHWRDQFHRWDGAAWIPVPDSDLDAALAAHCRAVFEADYPDRVAARDPERPGKRPVLFPVTATVRANVRVNLESLVNHPDTGADPPFWLRGGAGMPAGAEVIAAPNGLFTLSAVAAGRGPFAPSSPLFFTPNALPFAVPADAPHPAVWLRCLDEWFGGDEASIAGLQEWLGVLLTADTSAHKILLLVGPPRSGKGTIIWALAELAGVSNVSATTFAALGESFGLEDLLGKRVAVIPDARLSGRSDVGAVVERLLSISGEDPQSVNRKNRRRVTTRLRVRFVLATNEVPRLPDASGALASRFHILRTPNSWLGKEDRGLKDRLRAELPGILLWAARGWERLRATGMQFTPNDAAGQYLRELEDLSSPIRAFVRECCRTGPACEVEIPELYQAWLDWNEERKREVGSEQVFGRDLHAAIPHIATIKANRDGKRTRIYRGVGLKPRPEWGEDEGGGPQWSADQSNARDGQIGESHTAKESGGCAGSVRGPSRTADPGPGARPESADSPRSPRRRFGNDENRGVA